MLAGCSLWRVHSGLLALLLLCPLAPRSALSAEGPRVIGYERMYAATGEALAAGTLLLGELNCTSCHQVDERLSEVMQRKPAPVLDSVGSRVQPQYLDKFLFDPLATKPGTTMPHVLAALPEEKRKTVVEALVHFLATTGEVRHANPMRQHVSRGEVLFHTLGCVACHDPRKDPSAPPLATSIPLGTPSRKYTLPGLAQFLENPLAVRPGGRMPHLNLSPSEARDIASYLLNDLDIASGLQFAYYEGSWDTLPDFSKLKPVLVGDATGFDLSVAKRKEQFALRFDGTIHLDKAGEYRFLIGSDDGSRLLIDDKEIVKVDGVHPFQQARKAVKMTAGTHTVAVEYFEQGGEESLQVDFEAPGQTQQPLATLIAAPATSKGTAPAPQAFQVDAAKAAKGREYFTSLGCASCHTLRIGGQALISTFVAPPLSGMHAKQGCLNAADAKTPRYGLTQRQIESLATAIEALRMPRPSLSAAQMVERQLVRFNCYACHARGSLGGVDDARNAHFQSDMPEMGDEGRLPPALTGVGAKLNSTWLRTVFEQGAKDRPYMFTRMPKFGLENVDGLVAALEKADAGLAKEAPSVHPPAGAEEVKKYKAAGRRLVGAQGFSCIKCHTFADKRSTGIQALSLTTMTQRLRPDWFYHYLQNPLAYRPGTRMPTPFPEGQSTLPAVLGGQIEQQIGAIWTYLADGDQALLPVGLVTGKIEIVAFDEAVVYRNFLEGVGPRGIGVGYPEKLNLAFDASEQRLALLWHGGFIDAAKHWTGRGAGFEGPLGDNVLKLPEGVPLAALASAEASWPQQSARELGYQFRGYELGERRNPTFRYAWNGLAIDDYPRPVGAEDVFAMRRTITIAAAAPASGIWLRAARAEQIDELGGGSYRIDGRWKLTVESREPALRRQSEGQWELLVPVVIESGKATIDLTYDW